MTKFQVIFDGEVCKGCELCRAACPKGVIEMSERINNKGYSPASFARPDACIGCSSCALVCPDGAISIYKEDDK